ncbi:uncharacterized protein LOC125540498 isoform X2 [Triticum urartu]|uniref:uncharacterized protein LOC125540498 isoform X2 n=1 Tax=Triticum urartu TaxID=4572 RepID=UPI0020441E89|nr:uncharacterized protein LOC125540498 isoform X2 [Triticum urartu]
MRCLTRCGDLLQPAGDLLQPARMVVGRRPRWVVYTHNAGISEPMSCWGVLWPRKPSDSVVLFVAIAVVQLPFKTREEMQSMAGEAPELPASGGGARREEEPKLRWWRHSAGGAAAAASRGAPELGGHPGDRRCQVRSLAGGGWGYLVPAGETAMNRSGSVG